MKALAATLALLCIALAPAQDWAKARVDASPRHLEWVDVRHGDRTVKLFVAYPEKKDKATVVVLIHEIFGLTDWVQSVADQLAAEGFIAIAPDFLSGMGPGGGRTTSFEDVGAAREAIGSLPPTQITADLDAALSYSRSLPAANGKIAVAGFCWGGTQTFRYAATGADIVGAFVFYGSGPANALELAKVAAPVYGFYGENDNRVNATIPDSLKVMAEAGKSFLPVIYPGAGHGFMRAGEAPDASPENAEARAASWKRWLALLRGM